MLLIPVLQPAAQQNPFLTTSAPNAAEQNSGDIETGRPSPFFDSALMQKIKGLQKKIQVKISDYILDYKTEGSSEVILTFLIFSYVYGLIHVIGPGHRKIFLFSYFISSKDEWKRGMAAGFMTAVLHAVSAIILIGGLYLLTSKALLTRFNNLTPFIEYFSYGLIVLLGIFLLISNIIHFKKGHKQSGHSRSPGTILFVLASGLIPCPGAATIMIFSIAVQAPLVGVYSILAMSLGMGTVLALIPPAAIILQDKLNPVLSKWNPKTGERIHLGIAQAGAAVMIIFGTLFLI